MTRCFMIHDRQRFNLIIFHHNTDHPYSQSLQTTLIYVESSTTRLLDFRRDAKTHELLLVQAVADGSSPSSALA